MSYYHVVVKVGQEIGYRCLFTDLSSRELKSKFVLPYEKGKSFFANNELISPLDLKSIQIIETQNTDALEREKINREGREHIDELNRKNDNALILMTGGGYAPQDIAEAGVDVTHSFIMGEPGFKSNKSFLLRDVVLAIVASVVAAGIIKWLGWI